MNITVVLADKGTNDTARSTLNLLNCGWKQIALVPVGNGWVMPAHAVAVFFEVEHPRCNRPIPMTLELLTEDGQPVELPGPAGPQVMHLAQQITVNSPAGAPLGSPGAGNVLVEITAGMPLGAGIYTWAVTLDGVMEEQGTARFQVIAPMPSQSLQFGRPTPPSE